MIVCVRAPCGMLPANVCNCYKFSYFGSSIADAIVTLNCFCSEDMLKKSIDSFTSVVTERNALVNTALSMQLAVRTQLLQARIVDVEACKDIVKELVAGHYYAQEHSLVEDDLLFKRSQLSPQVSCP